MMVVLSELVRFHFGVAAYRKKLALYLVLAQSKVLLHFQVQCTFAVLVLQYPRGHRTPDGAVRSRVVAFVSDLAGLSIAFQVAREAFGAEQVVTFGLDEQVDRTEPTTQTASVGVVYLAFHAYIFVAHFGG